MLAGRYCASSVAGSGRVLTRAELRQVDLWGTHPLGLATPRPGRSCPTPRAGWPRLNLADAWGDHFTVLLAGCGRTTFPTLLSADDPPRVLAPISNGLAQLQQTLARLSAMG